MEDPRYKYCDVKNEKEVQSFDIPYHKNGKVRGDNHPLTVMAQNQRRVLIS